MAHSGAAARQNQQGATGGWAWDRTPDDDRHQAGLSASQRAAGSGPRPTRQRQQRPARTVPAMRVGQRSGLAAQRAGCPQLRRLEARVHASQVPGSGHSGLGYSEVVPTAASRRSRQGPGFKPAHDAQPAAPMDCTPPIGAEVLPLLSHAPAAMEVEGQPPPSQPSVREPDGMGLASSRVGRRSSGRRVRETAPVCDMDCDEPAVARNSTAQSCHRPPSEDTGQRTIQPNFQPATSRAARCHQRGFRSPAIRTLTRCRPHQASQLPAWTGGSSWSSCAPESARSHRRLGMGSDTRR